MAAASAGGSCSTRSNGARAAGIGTVPEGFHHQTLGYVGLSILYKPFV